MQQHITIVEYNPEWPGIFKYESEKIRKILGDNCVGIYHIGSTSVPGLAAKPIIDIMPVVKSLDNVDKKAEELEKLAMNIWGNLEFRADVISGKAAVTAHIKFTLSLKTTATISVSYTHLRAHKTD